MSSNIKRKRKNPHAGQYTVHHPSTATSTPAVASTSRTVTFDCHVSGRLGQQTSIAQVDVSAKDLAILAEDPTFSSFPDDKSLGFDYFQQRVQGNDNDNDNTPVPEHVP